MIPFKPRSLNEIESTFRKAIVGAGFSVGIAEDLSRAGGWLCAQGYDGVALILSAIQSESVKPIVSLTDDGVYKFKDVHISHCGPSAIDVLVAQHNDQNDESIVSEIHLSNIDLPLLMVALAIPFVKSESVEIEIQFSDNSVAVISPERIELFEATAGLDAVMKCRNVQVTDVDRCIEEARALLINEAAWQQLEVFAAKTYVPATEASRIVGAGAGLTDND